MSSQIEGINNALPHTHQCIWGFQLPSKAAFCQVNNNNKRQIIIQAHEIFSAC